MPKMIRCIFILLLTLVSLSAVSEPIKGIKLAIFDNPEIDSTQPSLSENVKKPYTEGIETACYVSHIKGIHITKKEFFYGSNLLSIIQQAPNVRSWDPDVVMGMYSSNAALMSNSLFADRLLLSISASDIQLSKLGANFYSLGTPDLETAKQMAHFITEQYPHRNLFLIIGAENKESVDFASLVSDIYKKMNSAQTVRESQFLSDDTNTMNIKSLVKGYQPGDVILLLAISGTYNIQLNLMNKISNFLTPNKLVFITLVDNWRGTDVLESTSDTTNPYTAFRFEGLYIDKNSDAYKYFAKYFEKIYRQKPVDNISFITYQTVMSIIVALQEYPPPKNLSAREAVLWSYQKALKHNPDWFRFKPNIVYKIEGHKEVYFKKLPEY